MARQGLNRVNVGSFKSVEEACSFPTTQLDTEKIVSVNLQGNSIVELEGVSEFEKAERVDLSCNAIEVVRAADLAGMAALQVLNLSSNLIQSLPAGSFPPLSGLKRLSLAYNKIENIDGLSVLENLQWLDLRGNCIKSYDNIRPLLHCHNLATIMFQSEKSADANPICTLPNYRASVTVMFQSLRELDGQEVVPKASEETINEGRIEQAVEMPLFDKATERFLQRVERDALVVQLSQPQENDGEEFAASSRSSSQRARRSANPWGESLHNSRRPRNRIVHTRVLHQFASSLSNKQKQFIHKLVTEGFSHNRFSKPILGIREALEQYDSWKDIARGRSDQILEPLTFALLLQKANFELSSDELSRFISLSNPSSKDTVRLLTWKSLEEVLVIARRLMSKLTQSEKQQPLQRTVSMGVQTAEDEEDKAAVVGNDRLSSSIGESVSNGLETGGELDLIVHGTKIETEPQEEQIDGTQNKPAPSTSIVQEKDDLQDMEPAASSEEVVTSATPSETTKTIEMQLLLQEIGSLKEVIKERHVTPLQERIEKLESQLENGLLQASQEANKAVSEYKEKLDAKQIEMENCYKSALQKLEQENIQIKSKFETCNLERQTAIEETYHFQQEKTILNEKLQQSKEREKNLTEEICRLREASSMTQKQLADQSSHLAEKLAESQSREKEFQAQAQARAKEATDFGDRVGSLLSDLQGSEKSREKLEEKCSRLAGKVQDLAGENERILASKTAEIQKLRNILQTSAEKLREEKEESKVHSFRAKELGNELEHVVSVVRDQKNQLERVARALQAKDRSLRETREALSRTEKEAERTVDSLEIEIKSLKRQIRDVDEERAIALKAQADCDAAKDKLAKIELQRISELDELKAKISDLQSALEVKNVMLNDQNESLEQLRRKANSLEKGCQERERDLEDEIHRLEDRLQYVEERRASAEESLEEQQHVIEGYEEAQKDLDSWREKAEKYEKVRSELDRKAAALDMIESEVATFREEYRKKERELGECQRKVKMLEESSTMRDSRAEVLETEVRAMKSEIITLKETLANKTVELETEREKLARCAQERDTSLTRLTAVEEENQKRYSELNSIHSVVKEKEAEIKVLAKALDLERRKGARTVQRFERLFDEIRRD